MFYFIPLIFHNLDRNWVTPTSYLTVWRFHVFFHLLIHLPCIPLDVVCVLSQSCPILGKPMDCSPPGSSVHVISQARILEWVATFYSKESSWPRGLTYISCIDRRFFTTVPRGTLPPPPTPPPPPQWIF